MWLLAFTAERYALIPSRTTVSQSACRTNRCCIKRQLQAPLPRPSAWPAPSTFAWVWGDSKRFAALASPLHSRTRSRHLHPRPSFLPPTFSSAILNLPRCGWACSLHSARGLPPGHLSTLGCRNSHFLCCFRVCPLSTPLQGLGFPTSRLSFGYLASASTPFSSIFSVLHSRPGLLRCCCSCRQQSVASCSLGKVEVGGRRVAAG